MQSAFQWVKSKVGDTVGKSISSAMKWGVIILVVLSALSLHTWWKQKRELKRIKSQCSSSSEEIFVVLIGEHSSKSTAQTLFSLFEKSSCPMRLKVGVYEFLDHDDSVPGGAIELYKTMAKRHGSSGLSYESNVTCMQRLKNDQGPYGALWEVVQHLLKEEKFVFILNDSLQLLSGWDSIAIQSLNDLPENSVLIQNAGSSFPYLSEFKEDLPEIGFKEFHSTESVEVAFWSRSSSFSSSKLWKDLGNHRTQFKHIFYGIDVLVSAGARRLGWRFFSSDTPYVTKLHQKNSSWTTSKRRITQQLELKQYFKEVLRKEIKELDLFPPGQKALMGVCDESDETEVNAKYGSMAEFLYQSGG